MGEAMDELPDGLKPSQAPDPVDEFEAAFQKCLTVLEKPETVERMTSEEMRSAVDNNIMRFIDLGRSLESFFLRKRFLISLTQPEQIIKEDIAELKTEIQRKDALIQRHSEKVAFWQSLVNSTGPVPATGVSPVGPMAGMPQGVPHGMMAPGGMQQQMRMMSPGAPQHARMPGAMPMMQPPMPAGHLANLERAASNVGMQ
ncbi:unnamed protein product [Notodromas monacha]|uniref:Mediator of RNA polymerase II transcription subunit 28 n=1 Tax=Notodromas monacha TaxID=399045 RepID=A0A7R9GF45_9CRUS|nr:unnamed protein product [Notodromas monacha]CAG0918952.1 unnamed protein product [Notodromas monacha]